MSTPGKNPIVTMPMIALRGTVAFPKLPFHFEAGRKLTVNAVNTAINSEQFIFLAAQKDIRTEDPTANELYDIGVVAKITQVLKVSPNNIKVLCDCLYKAKRVSCANNGKYWISQTIKLEDTKARQSLNYKEALARKIRAEFERYIALLPMPISDEIALNVAANDDLAYLSNYVAANIPAPIDDKQYVLEQTNPVSRAKILLKLLEKECQLLQIDNMITENVKHQMDENQREYYLREQIKAINNELYGDDLGEDEEYFEKIGNLLASDEVKQKLSHELNKLLKMPQGSQEATVVRNYLDICLNLPWNKTTDTNINIKTSAKILDRDFYGMDKVKERILEMLSVCTLAPQSAGQIICLVGPPGVGKTSIGKTIAECMGRKFARVSLGGISDEADIRGHRRTYIGAMPGKIISAVSSAKTSNPLILLDEIDKLGKDYKGDPAAALLEVLDGEQNFAFVDHYIDMPYDLSKALFITTANTVDTIPPALLDRLELIELTSYTREEKFNIAKRHLIKKQLAKHGLNKDNCKIKDSALYDIIDYYTREAGVRNLDRTIGKVCRKCAKLIVEKSQEKISVGSKEIITMLGAHKYRPEVINSENEVGIINGLAWTSVGGEIMQIEATAIPGTGKLVLTGSLGDVMQESAKAAVTYVRSRCDKFGINSDFYKDKDIHIHATEAAIPKDGPSAGITMTTALVSALTDRPIKRDIAMTGEITIRGRVLPIGGLKEKSIAAYRGGVKKVIIPYDNLPDLETIDHVVKDAIQFIPVKSEDEVIEHALL